MVGTKIRDRKTSFSHQFAATKMRETEIVDATNKKVRSYIPDDIILFILSKLPLKSLRRFACVCKSWALLFQNTYFMTLYINNLMSSGNHYDDTYLVLNHNELPMDEHHCEFYWLSGDRFENKVKIDWPTPFQENNTNIYILGSVSINGILCLKQGHGKQLVLWNPTTREFNIIPQSPLELVPPHRIPCYNLHGFGYDHVANEMTIK
jgi:molecular chaperone HtpG